MVSIKTDYVINPGTAKTVGHILVIHATADNGATAANIAAYEHRTWKSAFVHYAVDDKGAYQIGKPGYKAYGTGNVNRYAPVQIELCQFTDKTRARKAYSNFVALVKQMAAKHGIPASYIDPVPFKTKLDGEGERKYIERLDACGAEVIVLAGFMRIVKAGMLEHFPFRVLNIHPALLPAFPGVAAWKQALDYGAKVAGCTVHFVDLGTDTGPIIVQKSVPVLDDDTPETLHARIQVQEHLAYPEALSLLATGKLRLEGRKVVVEKA